jgi:hypothetical protein
MVNNMRVLWSNQQVDCKHDEGIVIKTYTHCFWVLFGIMWEIHIFKHKGIVWKKIVNKIIHPHYRIESEDGMRLFIQNVYVTLNSF